LALLVSDPDVYKCVAERAQIERVPLDELVELIKKITDYWLELNVKPAIGDNDDL